jgi:hypothetical protein
VVVEVLANTRQVYDRGNADLGVEFWVADARDLKKLRAVQRTSCEDDLLLCRNGLVGGVVG